MRIACLGGGPAGLYFAILMKKANPAHDITVIDRNAADNTFGWGIVFSDKTMDGFREADEQVVNEIEANFHHWDDIDVHFKGRKITSGGHGFCGIARLKLLQIFQKRAAELGVNMLWEQEITDPDAYARDYDLVVGADGVPVEDGRLESVVPAPHLPPRPLARLTPPCHVPAGCRYPGPGLGPAGQQQV